MCVTNPQEVAQEINGLEEQIKQLFDERQPLFAEHHYWHRKLIKFRGKTVKREEYAKLKAKVDELWELCVKDSRRIDPINKELQCKISWLRLISTGSRLKPEDQ